MRLAVLKERDPQETRVAAVPDSVKKLIGLGLEVAIESGAGERAGHLDQAYRDAGATVEPDAASALNGAGIVFAVQTPDEETIKTIAEGTLLVATIGALTRPELAERFAEAKIDACAMELLPRITRAQTMDVLSSQANLAGYRAVIEAAEAFSRSFPMMMTAAGTVAPARTFIVGAGVAGLQAIATARRLGGIVSATDVRPAAKEEVKSLGANFVGVEDEESKQQTGAYAKEMSEEFRRKQAELVAETVGKSDIVICTALVLGRKAPVIVSEDAVKRMKPGSVIVDIAADAGGNCAMTQPGERIVTDNAVTILGYRNWPSRIGIAASGLYARNLFTFLSTFWDKEAGKPKLPEDDDIIKGVLLTRGGSVVHPNFKPKEAA